MINRLYGEGRYLTSGALFLSVLLSFLWAANVQAISNRAATPQVQAELVASVSSVEPGAEFYVGLNQKIIPNWHTYWINPGDSGSATTIEWTLPNGATASEIIWPAPSRYSMGPITNYAYDNEVTLLTQIKVPGGAIPGEQFTLQALVDWLVCEEECIPQQVELALSFQIVPVGESEGVNDPRIDDALARLPVASPWDISATQSAMDLDTNQSELTLHIALSEAHLAQVKDIWFYPYEWGRIQQSSEQLRKPVKDGLELSIKTGEAPLKVGDAVTGVLVITEQSSDQGTPEIARGFEVNSVLQIAGSNPTDDAATGFFTAIVLALLGGIILNLMPCVFPVLSIKALSLVSHSKQSPAQIRSHGLVYTLGVLVSFAFLALLLILLKAGGAQIGWGFQFQSPLFVLAAAYLMFAVGLSLSGVFFVGSSVAGLGSSLTEKPGYSGSFFTGVLATIVATPCTAPFMAVALGYALAQPPAKLSAVFLSLGVGLALPYLLLTWSPRMQRWLPRPGMWMERAKQVLAFPMYATAIWLVWVLVQQAGVNSIVIALGGMLLIAFAAWLYDTTLLSGTTMRRAGTAASLALLLLVLGMSYLGVNSSSTTAIGSTTSNLSPAAVRNWEPYSEVRLKELLSEGRPVFLNFTAAWCISCLVNERVALSDVKVTETFQQQGIVYLKGDWTNRDSAITQFLQKFNRSGVPFYVFYPAGEDKPIELPQILTPEMVISAVTGH